jgi:hypothetical protein
MSFCDGTPLSAWPIVAPLAIRICALHEVDAGDVLGHRVLDLNARIHFDEVELAGRDVFEEFDGAGVLITDGSTDRERIAIQLVATRLAEEHAGARSTTF